MFPRGLNPQKTKGASIKLITPGTWRLEIPAGESGKYRLAQLDDYANMSRRDFTWDSRFRLQLQARSSEDCLPGTWGFGLWNDPFSMSILSRAGVLRLPELPNSAWFFFASAENHLTLRDDLPANGKLASTFCSPRIPSALLLMAMPFLPLLLMPPFVRFLRRWGRKIVRQEAVVLDLDSTEWHTYELEWSQNRLEFQLDGSLVLQTSAVPQGPLGLVLWIDNQYAALPPSGRVKYGTLPTPPNTWIEIRELSWGQNPKDMGVAKLMGGENR
jgi:hypothetical protein